MPRRRVRLSRVGDAVARRRATDWDRGSIPLPCQHRIPFCIDNPSASGVVVIERQVPHDEAGIVTGVMDDPAPHQISSNDCLGAAVPGPPVSIRADAVPGRRRRTQFRFSAPQQRHPQRAQAQTLDICRRFALL